MGKWFIALVVLLLVVVGVVLFAASRLDTYLDANRAWLEAKAETALGRQVSFDALHVSLLGALGVRLTNLRVADDPAFGREDLLRAKRAEIVLRILPALFGRYEISRIVLEEPVLTVIRTGRGSNLDSWGAAPLAEPPAPSPVAGIGALAALLVSALELRDGELLFIDRTRSPPAELRVRALDLSMADVGLTSPMRFDLAAAVLGGVAQNVKLTGTAGPLLSDGSSATAAGASRGGTAASLPRAPGASWGVVAEMPLMARLDVGPVATGDLRRLPWLAEALPPSLDGARPVRLRATAEGALAKLDVDGSLAFGDSVVQVEAKTDGLAPPTIVLTARSDEFRLAALGLASRTAASEEILRQVDARGTLRVADAGPGFEGSIRSEGGSVRDVAYTDFTADLRVNDGRLGMQRFAIHALGGLSSGSAEVDAGEGAHPAFHVQSAARGLTVAELLALSPSKETPKLSGKLDADVDIRGAGTDWVAIQETLAGLAGVNVRDGVLRDFNVGEQVLTAVSGIPGLTNLISPRIRSKYPGIFSTGDTRFEALRATARIARGRAATDDLTLATRDYALRAKGWIAFDNRLDLDCTLVVAPALTADLIAAVKEVELLTDGKDQMEIPFTVRGKLPKLRVTPDAALLGRALERALQTGVEHLFRGKKRASKPPAGATPRPEVDLLRKGLDSLLRR